MKVLALSADQGGCHFYRIGEPSRVAKALGVEVMNATEVYVDATIDQQAKRTTVHEIKTDADLIIIQRPMDNAFTSLIEQAKRQGIATIVELDDDFHSIHRQNMAYDLINGKDEIGPQWIAAAARAADHVTVSTTALAKYAPHGRYTVLRNCVPESIFDLKVDKPARDKPVVGWSGTVQTHPVDLLATKGIIGQVVEKNGLSVGIVGDGGSVREHLGLHSDTEMVVTGWVDVEYYYAAMAATMNIGIVPLEMSPFNQAKSNIKGLEMAALGIPFIATPTREYERLEVHGVGKTAKSPGEWRKHLQRWIDRPSEMQKNIEHYQSVIKSEMTYEARGADWVDAWQRAIDYRKSQ
jgi:glycosyltransferase involved in cell wall biosynthesis